MTFALLENGGFAMKKRAETTRQRRSALTKRTLEVRMADRANIPVETLRQLLAYDPETGKLTWLERKPEHFKDGYRSAEGCCNNWNAKNAGREAFTALSGGYLTGAIGRRPYKAHRVAWALHYGEWPCRDLDHINGNPSDNRIANLREVDHQENMRNLPLRRNTRSGVTGVSWIPRDRKWNARIGTKNLGHYESLEEAIEARRLAEVREGYHPNHGRQQCRN